MRRLWMSLLLLVPVLALIAPVAASAATTAASRPAAATAAAQPAASKGFIKAVQQRLNSLGYYAGPADGTIGTSTLEAIWAFEEVQGLPTHSYVDKAFTVRLQHPRAPKVLDRAAGANRVEVHLRSGYLVLWQNNKVRLISHISPGGGYYFCNPGGGCGYAITPTGNFKTIVYMSGWVTVPLGEMYNPVFFIGTAYAIHGDTDVPLAPVSHGCVRVPMDIAAFFHKLVKVPGEPVIVRNA
jgi:peptidoglycan hydrolase-like protein with peptidoglycan-binding domain